MSTSYSADRIHVQQTCESSSFLSQFSVLFGRMKCFFLVTFVFGLVRSGILPEGQNFYSTPNREFQQGDIDVRTLQSGSFIADNQIIDGESHDSGLSLAGNFDGAGVGLDTNRFSGHGIGLASPGVAFSSNSDSKEVVGVQFSADGVPRVGGSSFFSSSGSTGLEEAHIPGSIGVPLIGVNAFSSTSDSSKFGGAHFQGNIREQGVGQGEFLSDSGTVIGGDRGFSGTRGSFSGVESFKETGQQTSLVDTAHGGSNIGLSGGSTGHGTSHSSGLSTGFTGIGTGLQDSLSGGGDLFSNFLGGIAIPTPSVRGGGCKPNIVVQTVQVTSTIGAASTVYNEVVTTITRVSTTAIIIPQTSVSVQTVMSTVYSTQFITVTRTEINTETRTSEIRQQPQTLFNTVTRTMVSTVFRESTAYVTSTNVIPTTVFSDQIIRTTLTQFQTKFITDTVTQTIPGQTQFQTQFQTNTQFVTQTLPGQTIFNTRTIYSTVINNVVSTLPAQRSTVFSTEIIPLVSTVYRTQFLTQTQTQFVERTQFQTQIQSAFSTYYVTSTQYQEQIITQSSERIRTSVLNIPTQIVSTVESTRFQNQFQTRFVTDTRRQVVTITAPGQQLPVYQTTTVYNPVVSTSYFTNNAVNAITVTRTVQANCGIQVSQTGYNYNNPSQPFNILPVS